MKYRMQILKQISCFLAVFLLILDSKTAFQATADAIFLCLKTVIPSLFPMGVLTAVLTSQLLGKESIFSKSINSICKAPTGTESIFFTGLLGGYPLGAKNTALAYSNKCITKKQAERLLAFCSNAGPAFIFGMCLPLFSSPALCWLIWLIMLISSVYVANILPMGNENSTKLPVSNITFSRAISDGVRAMSIICGWIIMFKILISFLNKWVLFIFRAEITILISCLLELTNGITSLQDISNEGIRFIICTASLSFGGICVLMQTSSLIGDLNIKKYIVGKVLQTAFSFILSVTVYYMCYIKHISYSAAALFLIAALICAPFLQKIVEFFRSIIYNTRKMSRGKSYAVSKKDRAAL